MSIKSADGAEETDGNDNDNRRRGSVSQSVSQSKNSEDAEDNVLFSIPAKF